MAQKNKTSESNIEAEIRLAAAKLGTILFRNNVAKGWQGNVTRLSDGSMHIQNPRILHAGLFVGSSDEIGYTPIVITQEMVGKTVAVFTSIEVKHNTKLSPEQITWLNQIRSVGGIAGVARSVEDVVQILTQARLW
jgi:hypothetical protein